jgi:hypothetical protein
MTMGWCATTSGRSTRNRAGRKKPTPMEPAACASVLAVDFGRSDRREEQYWHVIDVTWPAAEYLAADVAPPDSAHRALGPEGCGASAGHAAAVSDDRATRAGCRPSPVSRRRSPLTAAFWHWTNVGARGVFGPARSAAGVIGAPVFEAGSRSDRWNWSRRSATRYTSGASGWHHDRASGTAEVNAPAGIA